MVCQAPSAMPFLFKISSSGKVPEDAMLYVLWRSESPRGDLVSLAVSRQVHPVSRVSWVDVGHLE